MLARYSTQSSIITPKHMGSSKGNKRSKSSSKDTTLTQVKKERAHRHCYGKAILPPQELEVVARFFQLFCAIKHASLSPQANLSLSQLLKTWVKELLKTSPLRSRVWLFIEVLLQTEWTIILGISHSWFSRENLMP